MMRGFRPYRGRIVVIFFLTVGATLLDLIPPFLIRQLFDRAIPERDSDQFVVLILAMAIIPTVRIGVSFINTLLNARVGQTVMRDLRQQLYQHVQRLPVQFFASTRAGDIQSRLSNDINGAESILSTTFVNTVRNASALGGTLIAMIVMSPIMTLISFALLPLVYFVTTKAGAASRRAWRARQESAAALTSEMQESLSLSGALLVKTFGQEGAILDRIRTRNQELTDLSIHQQLIGVASLYFNIWMFSFAPIAVYLLAGWQLIHNPEGTLTIGTVIAFTLLQGRLVSGFGPVSQLLELRVHIQGSLALFDRIFEYIDLPVTLTDSPNARQIPPDAIRGCVEFHHVWFSYESPDHWNTDDRSDSQPSLNSGSPVPPVLTDVTFTAEPGQLVALVGPSGAGKTTITNLVQRLYDVDAGMVHIDGVDVRDLTLGTISGAIGTVTQEVFLFHTSIRENLLFAKPTATMDEIIAATKVAAIHDRILELEQGYETVVGERGFKLSGGEKQRVAIARAVLRDPRILILDEATSSLDSQSERLVQVALSHLMRGRTTLAIAHRLSTVIRADQILVVDRGEIRERGTHQELLAQGNLYARLYRHQFDS